MTTHQIENSLAFLCFLLEKSKLEMARKEAQKIYTALKAERKAEETRIHAEYLEAIAELEALADEEAAGGRRQEAEAKTILEQYAIFCDDDKAKIICPKCGVELTQFDNSGSYEYFVRGLCPICDCESDDPYKNGKHDWCEHCTSPCEERHEYEKECRYEDCADREIRWMKELGVST